MLDIKRKMEIIQAATTEGYQGNFTDLFIQEEKAMQQQQNPKQSQEQQQQPPPPPSQPMAGGMEMPQQTTGDLVQSYQDAPPGIENNPTGADVKGVVSDAGQYETGGFHKVSDIIEYENGGYKQKYTHGGSHDYTPAEASSTSVYRPPNNLTIEEKEVQTDQFGSTQGSFYESKPEPSTFDKVINVAANPLAAFGRSVRGEDVNPGYIGRGENAFDTFALGMINPASWIESGQYAASDFKEGNYVSGSLNALGALPVVPAGIKGVKNLKALRGAKNLKALNAADKATDVAETAHRINTRNKVYTPTTKEKGVIKNIKQKNIDYVKSEEYITKRMANTGESKESIMRQVDDYIEEANRVTPQFKPKHQMGDAAGNYKYSTSISDPNSKINILNPNGTNKAPSLFEKKYLEKQGITLGESPKINLQQYNTIDHEYKHLFSPTGKVDKSSALYKNAKRYESSSYKKSIAEANKKFSKATTKTEADNALNTMLDDYKNINSQFNVDETMIMKSLPKHSTKAYKNYPTLNLKGDNKKYIKYLQDPAEQQVRLVRAGDYFKKNYGWDGTKTGMTDDMLEKFTNSMSQHTGATIPHDVRALVEASTNTAGQFRNVLSKAWATVPVGLGALSQTDTKQKGGVRKDDEFPNLLPEVEVSALTDKSYNKLSDPQKQLYDSFETPGGTAQTVDIGDGRQMHWKGALQMTKDLGVRNIYNKPTGIRGKTFQKLFARRPDQLQVSANPLFKNITVHGHDEFKSTLGSGKIKRLEKNKSLAEEGKRRFNMTTEEMEDKIKEVKDIQEGANRENYFGNVIAELAHIPEFWRTETFKNLPKSLAKDAYRFIKGEEMDNVRYHDKDHYEYKTHTGPDSFEERLKEKYKVKRKGGERAKVKITMKQGGYRLKRR